MSFSLSSMTGYGAAKASVEGWRIRVECKSVNHRRLSLRVYTPDELRWLDPEVRSRLTDAVSRGSVEVRIAMQPGTDDEYVDFDLIDEDRFSAVTRELQRLAVDYRLVAPVSLEAIWEYREFFERSSHEVFSEENADLLIPVVEEALQKLMASRRDEGQGIAADLDNHRQRLADRLDDVESLSADDGDAHRLRVETRLREAIEEFEIDAIDEGRLAQEVAYYVEKGDISEEIQRARSHVEKLGKVLRLGGEAVGKKIDFYLQELIRETNTMGSKSQHARLTDLVIEMKSVIEKMREQAANVE